MSSRTLSALVTCLLSSVAFAGSPSRVDAALAGKRGFVWKRSGWTADAYLLKTKDGGESNVVYKRIKKTIPSGKLMPEPDASMRRAFRDQTLWVLDGLKRAPEFQSFAHLLPTSQASGRFAMLQGRAAGVPIDTLPASSRPLAQLELARVKKAAEAALPGVEIDANEGNIFFHKDGTAASLFDPAGGWWARLLQDKVSSNGGYEVNRRKGPFHVGSSLAWEVKGGDVRFGEGWVIANVERKRAFVVKHGFLAAYRTAYEKLGAPIEDEREVSAGHFEQRFAHGNMTWDAQHHTRVSFGD